MGTEEDATAIFQEMYQKDLIPQEAISRWKVLAIELDFGSGEVDIISQNAIQRSVESCSLDMLKKWRQQAGSAATPENLIKALRAIKKNYDAKQLQDALDRGTFEEDYRDHKIAKLIASYWDTVGIELGVTHLSNIRDINNPTEHKFKEMLLDWLSKQTCSKREVYIKLHKALLQLELNAAAKEFKDKVNEAFNFDI